MQIQKFLLVPFVFCAAALSAQTLLNDSFTSAPSGTFGTGNNSSGTSGIGVQNPPSSVEWFSNTFVPFGSTTTINYINGSGISFDDSSTQSVTAYFESAGNYASLNVGNTLTLSFNFTISSPSNDSTGLRFGIFNSGSTSNVKNQLTRNTSTTLSAGNAGSPTGYSGYYVGFDAGANSGTFETGVSTLYSRAVSSNTSFIATVGNDSALGNPATNTTPGLGADNYQATLTLDYASAGTMNVSFGLTDLTTSTALAAYDDTAAATIGSGTPAITSLTTSFDGLSIGELGGQGGPMTISNVTVSESEIPEPSAYAAILGVATLGFVAIRGRRQRAQA
jgi:hypothetical protein